MDNSEPGGGGGRLAHRAQLRDEDGLSEVEIARLEPGGFFPHLELI